MEVCYMVIKRCWNEIVYQPRYALVAQWLCINHGDCRGIFEDSFRQYYSMIRRLNVDKIRIMANFYADLLGTEAISWHVLDCLHLTVEQTSPISRIFIKILFQELSNELGINYLNERLSDPTMQHSFESMFPKDSPRNARFAIDFFTSIGLVGLTEDLRQYLATISDSDAESIDLDFPDTESIDLAYSDTESIDLAYSDTESINLAYSDTESDADTESIVLALPCSESDSDTESIVADHSDSESD